jgi:hypothetical protein
MVWDRQPPRIVRHLVSSHSTEKRPGDPPGANSAETAPREVPPMCRSAKVFRASHRRRPATPRAHMSNRTDTMDSHRIEIPVEVAAHRILARAAGSGNRCTSNLSRSAQTLESELGTALLDRSKRELELTTAGMIVVSHTREIPARADAPAHQVGTLPGERRPRLTPRGGSICRRPLSVPCALDEHGFRIRAVSQPPSLPHDGHADATGHGEGPGGRGTGRADGQGTPRCAASAPAPERKRGAAEPGTPGRKRKRRGEPHRRIVELAVGPETDGTPGQSAGLKQSGRCPIPLIHPIPPACRYSRSRS